MSEVEYFTHCSCSKICNTGNLFLKKVLKMCWVTPWDLETYGIFPLNQISGLQKHAHKSKEKVTMRFHAYHIPSDLQMIGLVFRSPSAIWDEEWSKFCSKSVRGNYQPVMGVYGSDNERERRWGILNYMSPLGSNDQGEDLVVDSHLIKRRLFSMDWNLEHSIGKRNKTWGE